MPEKNSPKYPVAAETSEVFCDSNPKLEISLKKAILLHECFCFLFFPANLPHLLREAHGNFVHISSRATSKCESPVGGATVFDSPGGERSFQSPSREATLFFHVHVISFS